MPRRKALLIGINYTGSKYELAGCVNDVEHGSCFNLSPTSNSWSDYLQFVVIWLMTSIFLMILPGKSLVFSSKARYSCLFFFSMVILTDIQHDPRYRPTGQNMLAAFHWLVTNNNPGDSLFLHYSGHGECWWPCKTVLMLTIKKADRCKIPMAIVKAD